MTAARSSRRRYWQCYINEIPRQMETQIAAFEECRITGDVRGMEVYRAEPESYAKNMLKTARSILRYLKAKPPRGKMRKSLKGAGE